MFSDFKYNERNCISENEAFGSLVGLLKYTDGTPISIKENYIFKLSTILDTGTINEVTCELYPLNDNVANYYQMDCNLEANQSSAIYATIAKDETKNNYIYIKTNFSNIFIEQCFNYHKFINFNGDMEMKCNSESSQLEISLNSEIVGFEKEESFTINLSYPTYSYIDCMIPSSKSNNNEHIRCVLDTYKFPLTEEDYIIIPYELKNESISFTKWKKLKKELKNINCAPKYANIFYSDHNQNVSKCDNKGNNLLTFYGSIDSNKTNTKYNFDIL